MNVISLIWIMGMNVGQATTPEASAVPSVGTAKTLACFLLTAGSPKPELEAAFKATFVTAGQQLKASQVIGGEELQRRLKAAGVAEAPDAAALRCGSDIACIADLGRKVAANEVLVVRISDTPDKGGVIVRAVAFSVDPPQVVRKAKLQFNAATEVVAALVPVAPQIFGEPWTPAPAEAVAKAAEPAKAPESPAAKPAVVEKAPALAVTAAPPANAGTSEPWWKNRPVFLYGGIGAAGVGVAAFVVGAIFGFQSRSTADSISATIDQPEVIRREDRANSQASKANVFMLTGGLVALLGGGALAWDQYGVAWYERVKLGVGVGVGVGAGASSASAKVSVAW